MSNPRYNKQTTNQRVAKAEGGMLKEIPADKKKSLGKLPTKVRNKMGFYEKRRKSKKIKND
jgi:hypothetical protein